MKGNEAAFRCFRRPVDSGRNEQRNRALEELTCMRKNCISGNLRANEFVKLESFGV